jgi:diguanylate cyclase (GGDEF)-like protein
VLRAGDTIARLGGDEFVIVLPAIGSAEDARRVGEKVVAALDRHVEIDGKQLRVGASFGAALYPRDGEDAQTLMRRADKAMYRAKSAGRGKVQIFQNLSDSQWS